MNNLAPSIEELERLAFHRPERGATLGAEYLAALPSDSPERIPTLVRIATALSQIERLDEAEEALRQVERERGDDVEWILRADLVRAHILIRRGEPQRGADLLPDVIATASERNLCSVVIRGMALRAKALVMAGAGTEALRLALHTRGLTGEDPELRFLSAEALGFVHVQLKDDERAQEPCREALDLARRLNQDVRIAGTAANLGASCSSLGRYDEALLLLKESEEAAARSDCLRLLVYALWRTACVYIHLRDLEGVRSAVDRALPYAERLGRTFESASVFLLHAQVLLHCGEQEEGIRRGESVLAMISDLREEDIELATLATLAPCWEEEGKGEEAIEAYKRMLEIKRSQASRFNPRNVERLAITYENGIPGGSSPEGSRHDRSPEVQYLATRYPHLSPIELTVCGGVLHGETSQEIADRLCLSVHTIDTHRRTIRRKLGLKRGRSLHTALLTVAAM